MRAETGGLFQAQNAGEQSEFGSQTTLRLTNPPEFTGVSVYPETAPVCRDCMVGDERDMAEIASDDYPGERLIVCRNPELAAERARKRAELIEATEKALAKIRAATERKRNPLRGKDKIGLRVGAVIDRRHMAKHFELAISDQASPGRARPRRSPPKPRSTASM